MAVKVGSARIDERGRALGGKAGDQTGREVCTENWYRHSLGWYVIRAKSATVREKIAKAMERACANNKIGYDQGQNKTLWAAASKVGFDPGKVTTPCETDCARLVRVCVKYAGINSVDFYTGNELAALNATGKFIVIRDSKYCNSSDYLVRGDILVTRSKGHTVVVLSNGAKVKAAAPVATKKPAAKKTTTKKAATPSYTVGKVYTVQVNDLNVRKGAGTGYAKKSRAQLTADAQKHADAQGQLKKGTKVTCKATKTVGGNVWMKIPSGWVAAYYAKQYYVK